MNFSLLGFFLLSSPLVLVQKDAEQFAKEQRTFALEQMKNFSIEAPEFSPKIAKEKMEEEVKDNELVDFLTNEGMQKHLRDNKGFHEDEYFFKSSEEAAITQGTTEEIREQTHLSTCLESGEPYPVFATRTLQSNVIAGEKKEQNKVCCGHKKKKEFFWKADAKDWVSKKKKQFSQDPMIKSFEVDYSGTIMSMYEARAVWTHVDNAPACDAFFVQAGAQVESVIVEEKWVYDLDISSLTENPDCTLMDTICLESNHKQCIKEKLCFICRPKKEKGCSFLRDKNCVEVKRKCVQEGSYGCSLWELTYKCFDKISRNSTGTEQDQELFALEVNTEYEPNQSFSAVATKMKIFEEMKTQIEQSGEDAFKVQLFKGKKKECSKSVADKLLYDCCFAFGGLAKDLKLSQCSEEEVELGALREKDLCRYVGKYAEEFIDLWKSRDVNVFCCFPSKLSRIFQEEAREQLGMSWGTAEHPDCRGLLPDEIAKVDFSRLDLSEVYDEKIQDMEARLQEKLQALQDQLPQKLRTLQDKNQQENLHG